MALEYRRDYHTYFHVSQSYGVSESTCYEAIQWIENRLIKHSDFALPVWKVLLKSNMEYELILIDATETPIERSKKTKKNPLTKEDKLKNCEFSSERVWNENVIEMIKKI